MKGLGKPQPVTERAATGEIERVYHEIKQVLRVTGVNLNFRTWAAFDRWFPAMWKAMLPNAESRAFDHAADLVRADAMRLADNLGPLGAAAAVANLGESRAWQLMKAIDLYHSINPKLLVFTASVRQALENGPLLASEGVEEGAEALPRGIPGRMYPMEMVPEEPQSPRLADIFSQIRATFSLSHINSDYRTLALWPDYLEAAWQRLQPLALSAPFQPAAEEVRQMARSVARTLPHAIPISRDMVKLLTEDPDKILEVTREFERLLGSLILVIALLKRDWRAPQAIAQKLGGSTGPAPMPPPKGEEKAQWREPWREWQRKQRVSEIGERFISFVEEGVGEPILLLHGIPTWSFLWHRVVPDLAAHHRVLAPDLFGFGYSDKSDRFDRSLSRQMTLLESWLDMLNVQKVHVVGHDLGGGLALRLATILPERVASLCVINSVCYDAWPIEVMHQLGYPGTDRALSASKVVTTLRKALLPGFIRKPQEEVLEGLLAPYSTEVGKISLIRNASALNTNLTTEITPLLSRLDVPTTVIWGENDPFLPAALAERLVWDIPDARLVRIMNASHFAMLDEPNAVVTHLQNHLERAAGLSARVISSPQHAFIH